MIVGVPNVGKSSLINRLTGRKSAQIGNRPGVTRGKQWLTMENGMQLLDTPGILWPKFEDPTTGRNLAFCGAIKDEILDVANLALELIDALSVNYEDLLMIRYKIEGLGRRLWKQWRPSLKNEDLSCRENASTMSEQAALYWMSLEKD